MYHRVYHLFGDEISHFGNEKFLVSGPRLIEGSVQKTSSRRFRNEESFFRNEESFLETRTRHFGTMGRARMTIFHVFTVGERVWNGMIHVSSRVSSFRGRDFSFRK